MAFTNVFRRSGYNTMVGVDAEDAAGYVIDEGSKQVFSGGDLTAYVNNIQVGNLESLTFSSSVEVAGQFVMGRRDAVQYTQGKRVIVGSLMFAQYDKHALLEEVFQITRRGRMTQQSFWSPESPASALAQQNTYNNVIIGTQKGLNNTSLQGNTDAVFDQAGNLRGLSASEAATQRNAQDQLAAKLQGSIKIDYADQIPPFDLTLVGISRTGAASRCTIFGLTINQETGGWSMQDLGNSVGFSFVALHVSPWRTVAQTALQNLGTVNLM